MEQPNNTVFLCLHGSHLYGTDTPESDKDYKGIYKASLDDIILGRDQGTILYNSKGRAESRRNNKDDTDCEFKELRRFIKDALSGQIYAFDLLFSPESMWLENDLIWSDILNNRDKLLSGNIAPFVRYCNQQAGRYGLKGSRLAEVIRFRDWLGTQFNSMKVGEVFDQFEQSEYVKLIRPLDKNGNEVVYIQVLEKKYPLNQKCGSLGNSLSNWIKEYGPRSIEAMENKGVDYKAVSHAFRAVFQAKELLSTGKIQMPLKEAEYLKRIKLGEFLYTDLQDQLEGLMDELKQVKSVLPEEPDTEFWQTRLVSYYLNEVY